MKKTLMIAGLASVMALGSVAPAAAWRATEWTLRDVRRNTANTVSEVRELRNDVRTQSRILMEALRMQTGEQSAYADKQIEGFKRIMDGAQQNDTDRVRQEIRAEAESGKFDPDPDACLLIDLFKGRTPEGATVGGAQGTAVADSAAEERRRIGSLGPSAAARAMVDKETPVNGRDASMRAATFLETPTVDMTDEAVRAAAEAFHLRLTDPIPMTPVPEVMKSTPEGVALLSIQKSREARSSILDENIAMIHNMSSPVIPGEGLRKFKEGTPYNRDIPDMASELQAIDVMTVRHYTALQNNTAPVEMGVVLQRLYQITAIQARMQYIQLEMDRRNLMTQSTILAKLIENDGNE